MSQGRSWELWNSSKYQLPNRDWNCGHLADGHPCEIGPNAKGECCVQQICSPYFDGKTWFCNRPNAFGGKCQVGPVPDQGCPEKSAHCPHRPTPCQPVRSLRSQRRLITGFVIALSLGFCLLILGGSSGNSNQSAWETSFVVSPGPLSSAHAAIDSGCQACHTAAAKSPEKLLSFAFGGHHGIQESQKCLACHDEFGNHPLLAHSMPPDTMAAITNYLKSQSLEESHTTRQSLARRLTTQDSSESSELSCATCHREHRGANHDLTKLTNAQCQSCHQNTFHSFANGHPEIDPPSRARIHFDHATHLKHHFQHFEGLMPGGITRNDCSDCHTLSKNGSTLDLASYKQMCGSCHDSQIRDFNMPEPMRLDHFQFLRAIPENNATLAKNTATQLTPISKILGIEVPLFLEMMLAADPATEQILRILQQGQHKLDTANLSQYRSTMISSWKQLLQELNADQSTVVADRLRKLCSSNVNEELIHNCVDVLKSSYFFQALARYQKIEILDDSASGEQKFGNWVILNEPPALIYRASEHEDRLLKTWLDLLASQTFDDEPDSSSNSQNLFSQWFQERITPGATGRCMKCHTFNKTVTGSFAINWKTSHENKSSREFTFFSHGPHLTFLKTPADSAVQPPNRIQDCQSCHPLNSAEPEFINKAFLKTDGRPHPEIDHFSTIGLLSAKKQNCAQCHQNNLAGDNCLQCHNYHVHSLGP